ncbi:AAA family ATPase [Candidatus Hakubella thermalkaliphila]|uniref:AAA domain-containing protein n=1 Tax=Candidatus Hakubella thermalkaliphila TaxID=2754717 RepID=A0A6V8P1N8_9ACTN|nr:AAA family ATPase [Candidatus Hakubella thermalkaliphila]GFP25690.1 hypothetical protein HKBW3S25_01171 [Candidatus Hakubella thermalkaliphila]GFP26811.1 hypothetical protein HKBW3S33_00225 [Candidatus Hakubella thermalkaliphila]GFP42070.1 hypothetical protein HKBW3C_01196 [Candidatus Hakubella thermalkaliphila]
MSSRSLSQEAEENRVVALDSRESRVKKPEAKIICILSNKGGSGKTTLAVGLGVSLARLNLRTLILELDASPGDMAGLFDLDPTCSLEQAIDSSCNPSQYIHKIFDKLYVLLGPQDPLRGEMIKKEELERLVRVLAEQYDVIIFDTQPVLSDITLDAIKMSQETLVVSEPYLESVRRIAIMLDLLSTRFGVYTRNFKLLINKYRRLDPRRLTLRDVAAGSSLPIFWLVPFDKKCRNSMQQMRQGKLSRAHVVRSLMKLAVEICPDARASDVRRWV